MKYIKTYEFFSSGFSSTPKFSSLGSFITWSEKRYIEQEYTEDEFEEIITILENDCEEFLNEVRESKVGPIFRGVKNVDDTYTRGMGKKSSRVNRIPVDTDSNISEIIDNYFEDKFNIKVRSNGTFTSRLPHVASDYGKPYLFFPIGDYRYFWNPKIKDLYGDIEGQSWYYTEGELENRWSIAHDIGSMGGEWYYNDNGYSYDINKAIKQAKDDNPELYNKSSEYVKKVLEWKPEIELDSYIKNFKDELYIQLDNLVEGYKDYGLGEVNEQEITFICDKYYLVDPAFYIKYLEYLNDKNLDEYKKNNPD